MREVPMSIEVAAQSTQTTHNSKTTKTKANIAKRALTSLMS